MAGTSDLLPLANIVSENIYRVTGQRYAVGLGQAAAGDLGVGLQRFL